VTGLPCDMVDSFVPFILLELSGGAIVGCELIAGGLD